MSEGGFDEGYGSSEVTYQSWFSRLGNAIKGVLIGLFLFVVSFPLLFWNEGRAVRTYNSIAEAKGKVVPISSDAVDPANEGKLVFLTGKAVTDDTLGDPAFGVEGKVLRLRRHTQIYQWKETIETRTEKQLGGGTKEIKTAKYGKIWSDEPINSGSFRDRAGHENTGSIEFPSQTQTAPKITVGAFALSNELADRLNDFKTVPAFSSGFDKAADAVKKNWKVAGDSYYRGADPQSPAIGDQRVTFSQVAPADVSLYSEQTGNTFRRFQTKSGDAMSRIETGLHSAAELFQHDESENNLVTWILRVIGFVVMALGSYLVFAPLVVLADVLPFLGNILSMGVGLFAGLIAAVLSLITIAIAWVFYRPLLAAGLLAAAALLIGAVFYLRRRPGMPNRLVPPPRV
ncbi:MAG: TMEM43 family protein [Gemmataceae bacterium]